MDGAFGACPHHGTGAMDRREAGSERQRNGFGYFCQNKSDPAVRTEPEAASQKC
jgi:hypothetical protein